MTAAERVQPVPWVEVVDEDVGHPTVGRQGSQQLAEGLQAAGRRTDTGDRERSGEARRHARFEPGRGCDLGRALSFARRSV